MSEPDINEIEQALRVADAAVAAPEAQGCLCGALCTLPQFSPLYWMRELLPDPAEGRLLPDTLAIDPALEQLHAQTVAALRGADMAFAPLLPDDAQPITQRIAALAQWAQGFLYGFGMGAQEITHMPREVSEVLKDLGEIARADDTDSHGGDEEEAAYAELVEYLRAAVQLVHDELAPHREALAQQASH